MFEHVVFFALIMLLANVSLELFNSIGRYEGTYVGSVSRYTLQRNRGEINRA